MLLPCQLPLPCQLGLHWRRLAAVPVLRAVPALPAVPEKGIATMSSQADPVLAENSLISTIVEEQRAPATLLTSYTGFHRGSQVGPSSVGGCLAPFQVYPESLPIVDRTKEQICWWFIHITIM